MPTAKAGWWAPFCAGIIAEPLEFSNQDFGPAQAGMEFVQMHWPYPPNPAEYQSVELGTLVGVFVIALVLVLVVLYVTNPATSLFHNAKPKPEEAGTEEKEREQTAD